MLRQSQDFGIAFRDSKGLLFLRSEFPVQFLALTCYFGFGKVDLPLGMSYINQETSKNLIIIDLNQSKLDCRIISVNRLF